MRDQQFSSLVDAGLLPEVENLVVDGHRRLYARLGRRWSKPEAYRWLRYEDPDPVARLAEGVRRLRGRGVKFDAEAVEKACVKASELGFLN
ncbi:MAG TPA: hypothetical protein VET26_09095 [Candidatus Sulfotelmatobacter sp.]|nr:hypothetical protein [Candidatus Sulfotelmatobacter sp.]